MLDKGKLKGKWNSSTGLSLIELMVTVVILAIVLIGLLQLFIYCLGLGQMAGNLTIAITEAQGKLEEIRNHNFNDIADDYGLGGSPGNTFNLAQLIGTGTINIDDTNSELLEIEIVVSWQDKLNRVIQTSLVSLIAKR
ncbi:unnamed protein product [marine sediment metagenome]|uniref:Prepilin-type N-terminal cleavage/methylation domain-containing protein n=1 Tax=marine sediment metagenome TaxID=412755 RepID=X0W4U2_9ZZZZ